MNKIDQQLLKIKEQKRIGLMTHVVVGYPSLQETIDLVITMEQSGTDFIELQIPFSDPLADGSTIMKACEDSLRNGTTVKDALIVMKELSSCISVPLIFMAYYNTIFRYGVEKFCRDAQVVGASGLIVPDMPIDEEPYEHFYSLAHKYNLYPISVVSPASTIERLQKNAAIAKGFVYCTARQGTTGAQKELDPTIRSYLATVKKYFAIPLSVGFGISKKEQIVNLQKFADIAIIGSALIDLINTTEKNKRQAVVKKFITELIH